MLCSLELFTEFILTVRQMHPWFCQWKVRRCACERASLGGTHCTSGHVLCGRQPEAEVLWATIINFSNLLSFMPHFAFLLLHTYKSGHITNTHLRLEYQNLNINITLPVIEWSYVKRKWCLVTKPSLVFLAGKTACASLFKQSAEFWTLSICFLVHWVPQWEHIQKDT